MSPNKRMLLPLLAAPLSACVTSTLPPPVSLPGLHFAYAVSAPDPLHLVQAFDDGTNTYIQLSDPPLPGIEVKSDAEGRPLDYRIANQFIVVAGVYSNIAMRADKTWTTVINQERLTAAEVSALQLPTPQQPASRGAATEAAGSLAGGPIPRPSDSAAIRIPEGLSSASSTGRVSAQAHGSLDEKMLQLSIEIEDAKRAGGSRGIYLREGGAAPRVALTFEENSTQPHLDSALLAALGEASRAANRIFLHAHTDEFTASDAGRTLAIERAVAVKALLVSLNVQPQRVRLFYRGAGDFVANNSTPDGRALNRRVEIELRRW